MTNNPFFLPNFNPANYASRLLADTVGIDELPIDIFSIPEFLEEKDIFVYFDHECFENNSEYGVSILTGKSKIIFLNSSFYGSSFEELNSNDSKRRHCRFTLAHELGHCIFPTHIDILQQKKLINEKNQHSRKYLFQREYEANIFAAELLIPSSTINNIYSYGNNFKEIAENISKQYDASFLASMLKIAELCKDSICICLQINPDTKKIINMKYSEEFKNYGKGLFIQRGDSIYSGSLAYSLTKKDCSSYYQSYKEPYDWFPNFKGNSDAKLHEWSFRMGDNIITILELIDISDYNLYF